ncbi:head maturation protease, ClpP-related [Streptomyces sp. NPDC091215]|uniref:head maturation protease, ClpP-related n=1 Tax=Streptomyces sp. NPDC091215 TaxID=3155192 RepID=UPI00341D7B52
MKNVRPIKARISAQAGVTRVDVYDDIGEGGWFSEGLTAKSFANQLAGLTGPLEVHINSGGGDVWDGIAIKNAIETHKGQVTTIVDGIAASIASVIAQAGGERVMMPGSMLMIHEAFTYTSGNAAELTKTAQTLDEVSANLAAIYARAAGGTAEQWRAAMVEETWYTAEQAVEAGLADRVGDGEAALPAGFDMASFVDVPGRIAAQLRTLPHAAVPNAETVAAEAAQQGETQLTIKIEGALDEALVERLRAVVRQRGTAPLVPQVVAKALPVHHTATVDEPWDGPAAVAAMPNDDTVLEYCFAWQSDEAAATPHKEGDDDADDKKTSYKFPHHKTKGGPANLAACRNGLARLEGSSIPEGDKAGVRAHLQAHLDDAGDGDEGGTDNHAEGLPGWLTNDSAPLPAWLATAEEAKL